MIMNALEERAISMPHMRRMFLTIFVFLIISPLVVNAQNGTEPILTTDLLKLKTMNQIDVSADGGGAVFVVTSMGKDEQEEYRYFRHLWMVDLEKLSSPVQLTFGDRNHNSPTWSPDGTRIAFVRGYKGKPQIWVLPLQGGEAYRVTDAEFGASRPRWSPDGQKLLFSSSIPDWALEGEPTWPYERPGRHWGDEPNWKKIEEHPDTVSAKPDGSLEEIRAWLAKNASENNPRVFNRLTPYARSQGKVNPQTHLSFSHLFVVDAKPEAEATQITQGFQHFVAPDWSPDGTKIVCHSLEYKTHPDRRRYLDPDSDLWVMNADGTDAKLLLDWKDYRLRFPLYSPDGQQIVFRAQDRRERGYSGVKLAIIAADGGEPTPLTFDFDRHVGNHSWSSDSKQIYFSGASHGAFPLFRISATGGNVETVIGGPRGVRDYDIEGKRLVYALTEVSNPYELYVADDNGKNPHPITSFNAEWIKEKKIVFPQEEWLTGPDGHRIQYWVMEPANRQLGKKYPIVLEIHGGPDAMWGPGEFTMWHEFQLLTSRGFGVVYCNPRGSDGYGFAFDKARYRNWGPGPASDILAVASEAAKLEWVDAEQQVVTGGSYGGYMTAWIVSQDHRFKAAVAQRSRYAFSSSYTTGTFVSFGGHPWDEEVRDLLDAQSPLTFVEDIETPVLIMHADQDLFDTASELLYSSLKILDRPVEYVRYPNEGHELSRSGNPKRRMDRLNRIIEFFERFVKHPQ